MAILGKKKVIITNCRVDEEASDPKSGIIKVVCPVKIVDNGVAEEGEIEAYINRHNKDVLILKEEGLPSDKVLELKEVLKKKFLLR